jgi:ring-1,2-phenylacetyl-CoA epoxidase subunit PaaC
VPAAMDAVPAAVDAVPAAVDAVLDQVLAAAGLRRPDHAPLGTVSGHAGRDGVHTEALGFILAELQSVARADPDATW